MMAKVPPIFEKYGHNSGFNGLLGAGAIGGEGGVGLWLTLMRSKAYHGSWSMPHIKSIVYGVIHVDS